MSSFSILYIKAGVDIQVSGRSWNIYKVHLYYNLPNRTYNYIIYILVRGVYAAYALPWLHNARVLWKRHFHTGSFRKIEGQQV